MKPLTGGELSRVTVQQLPPDEEGCFDAQPLKLFISMKNASQIADVTNYTSSTHENGNVTVNFYISQQTVFTADFTCEYNFSNYTANFTHVSSKLVLAYVPKDSYCDTNFGILFGVFCSLFVVTLILLSVSCVCNYRLSKKRSLLQSCHVQNDTTTAAPLVHHAMLGAAERSLLLNAYGYPANNREMSSQRGDQIRSPLGSTRSFSDNFVVPERAADELLKILSHPSPCLLTNCSCFYYKQKLLSNLNQTTMQPPPKISSSSLYAPARKTNLGATLRQFSSFGQQERVDQGYSSGSYSEIKRTGTHSRTTSQSEPGAQPKDAPAYQVGKEFETRLAFSSPPPTKACTVDTRFKNACINNALPTPATLSSGVVPSCGHFSGVFSGSIQNIHYPQFCPDDMKEEELSGLSNEFDLNANFIDPVETIQFDSKGGSYANENHEVYVRIPKGAIPEGKTISIEVDVSFHSALVSLLPLDSKPVSPLVKLCVLGEPDFRFLKPIKITLPHFLDIVDEEDAEQMGLQFLKAGHSLYCFHKSDGVATFTPRASTATLRTTHFCTFCITANEAISVKKINYRLVKIVPKDRQVKAWRVNFCVSYYLRTCLQVTSHCTVKR